MSTAVLASSNAVLPLQRPNACLFEGDAVAGGSSIPIAGSECGIDRTTLEPGGATVLSPREGFTEEACPAENILRPTGILVVEDDWLLRKALGQGFRNRGFDLWSAANGAEGVELYQKFWPLIDIVLSDVQMPVLDGPGTLDALRKINPSVRLCFMTGDTRAATRARLLKRGALRVFEKPLSSVANVAQELWELAACPYQVIGFPDDGDEEATHPDRLAEEARVQDAPEEYRVFAWICAPLLTSMSRVVSMLGKTRNLHSGPVPPH